VIYEETEDYIIAVVLELIKVLSFIGVKMRMKGAR
jgi:hypothetical protein